MKKSLIPLLVFTILVFAESKGFLAKEEPNSLFDDDEGFEEAFLSDYASFELADETQGDDDFDIEQRLLIPENGETFVESESLIINEEDFNECGEEVEAVLPPKGTCITVTHCYLTDIPRIGKRAIYKTKVVCN